MSVKEMRFQLKCRLNIQIRRPDHAAIQACSEFQAVGPAIEKDHRCQMCCDETAEYSVCDGWPNGDGTLLMHLKIFL